ncbi:MAG: hypothetical protein ACR2OO_10155 [Thermomicrobiales bacterium]
MERLATGDISPETRSGPRWQRIGVGDRVNPKGRRKLGTVAAAVGPTRSDGTPMHVAVRWDGSPKWSEAWATDCLIVVASGGDMSRPPERSVA